MRKCKHKRQRYGLVNVVDGGIIMRVTRGQHRCEDCGVVVPLGHSDEHASERVEIEIRLAELLAQTECFWEPCGAKDEQFDLYVDIFATDEPPQQLRRPGPRSPIEMMVDAACGYDHDAQQAEQGRSK